MSRFPNSRRSLDEEKHSHAEGTRQNDGKMNLQIETAKKFYESARQELINRLQLRDNALFVFIGATGTVLGVALGTTAKHEVLLIIPFLSLALGFIVLQHHEVIGALGRYCKAEIGQVLSDPNSKVRHWDDSITLDKHFDRLVGGRSPAHAAILLAPGCWGLAINGSHFDPRHLSDPYSRAYFVATVFGACCEVMLAILVWRAHRFRKRLNVG